MLNKLYEVFACALAAGSRSY